MFQRIGRALSFGATAMLTALAVSSVTSAPGYAVAQMWRRAELGGLELRRVIRSEEHQSGMPGAHS